MLSNFVLLDIESKKKGGGLGGKNQKTSGREGKTCKITAYQSYRMSVKVFLRGPFMDVGVPVGGLVCKSQGYSQVEVVQEGEHKRVQVEVHQDIDWVVGCRLHWEDKKSVVDRSNRLRQEEVFWRRRSACGRHTRSRLRRGRQRR